MQRYANGLKVPKQQIDKFSGKTSDGAGFIELNLTHKPKSINDILVTFGYEAAPKAWSPFISTLVGKLLTLQISRPHYYRATAIDTATSGNTGADPHTHTITETITDISVPVEATAALPVIVVNYAVGG